MIVSPLNSLDASAQDSWRQHMAARHLPHRMQLGSNRIFWIEEGVEAWLRARMEDWGAAC